MLPIIPLKRLCKINAVDFQTLCSINISCKKVEVEIMSQTGQSETLITVYKMDKQHCAKAVITNWMDQATNCEGVTACFFAGLIS